MFSRMLVCVQVGRCECWYTGLLYDHGHLSRAVCCRLAHGEPDIADSLPLGFHINHPLLGRVTTYEPPREIQKTKELSMNWVLGDQQVELTDGTKGICISTYISRSCYCCCFVLLLLLLSLLLLLLCWACPVRIVMADASKRRGIVTGSCSHETHLCYL